MNKYKIKHPISLKHILLFSSLIILVLGVSTFLVSTLVRSDDKLKAEENNYTINARTAETVQLTFSGIKNNSYALFDAVSLMNAIPDKAAANKVTVNKLITDYFNVNKDIVFILSPDTGIKVNPSYDSNKVSDYVLKLNLSRYSDGVHVINSNEMLNPSVILIYTYGQSNAVKTAAVGLDATALASLMSTGSNNSTLLVDEEANIIVNPDFESKETKYEIAEKIINDIKNVSDNTQNLIETDEGKKFIAVHKTKDNLYVITSISEKSVFAVINKTTYRIILFSLAVMFIAIIIIRLFSNNITYPITELVDASAKIEQGEFELDIEPRTQDEIGLLTSSFIQMGHGLAEREKLMVSFSKFTNKTIAKKAASGELALGGENRNATIFFSDIRSFTAMSEKMQPNEVVEFLNEYMTRMVECVNKTNGVVDKYIGDAIMAVWGAPESSGSPAHDAMNAVTAALMMRVSLFNFNKQRKEKGLAPVKIGCGINSGPVVAGQIGSNERMEYTVIGDAVNLASRTEALNKPFATDILITENTYNLIKDKIIVEEMPGVHVKGKADAIKMFAVINLAGKEKPSTIDEVRKIIGTVAPDLSKVNTDDEEKKYNIESK
ncbi:MAG: HAMP domain-containing protein [Treponema sp.]|uniref:adenylate/guanylate cyclase domain-containing protein n=1 Tax=Treponema sp. TaxID=166 RepID=UPI00298D8901|nr:adenylate/guanylate cyclase domain-containing protein [Treponema sp.]MBR5933443.1 HAMP domain-containing protein [Treponema sp.]